MGKCLCQWWTALARLLCLAWRMLAMYLFCQDYLAAEGGTNRHTSLNWVLM